MSARSTILSSVLTGITCVVLLLLGALVGLLSTLNAAWMTRYWDAGHPVPILAVTGLLVFLAVLYTLCRVLAWGSRRPSGAVAFAIGFCVILLVAITHPRAPDRVIETPPRGDRPRAPAVVTPRVNEPR